MRWRTMNRKRKRSLARQSGQASLAFIFSNRDRAWRHRYAYEPIPVMLALNSERGNFTGKIAMVSIHDAIQLEHWDFMQGGGLECKETPGILWIEGKRYRYFDSRHWAGNVCWNLY